MKSCSWKKNKIHNYNGNVRYELKCGDKFTIDVDSFKEQGHAGSNQVNVFRSKYGGWILGTPRNFSTKNQVNKFVKETKRKLIKGEYGKQVPFPR